MRTKAEKRNEFYRIVQIVLLTIIALGVLL